MKLRWLYLWVMVVLTMAASAHSQKTAPGAKKVSRTKARRSNLLQPANQQDDPCFKDPFSGVLWAKHTKGLFLLAGAESSKLTSFTSTSTDKLVQDLQSGKSLDVDIARWLDQNTRIVDGNSHPAVLQNSMIKPAPLSSSSANQCSPTTINLPVFRPIENTEAPKMLELAQSVGRLQVKDDGPNGPEWVGIGTAFVVAPGVIATNCHVISDFVTGTTGDWSLDGTYANNFAVDFGESGGFSAEHGFVVTGMYPPPEELGMDVVFLSVEEKNSAGKALPGRLTLSSKEPAALSQPTDPAMVLVGYPSRSDTDSAAECVYGAFGTLRYNKFIVPGGVTTVQACKDPLRVILNTVSTTPGQSGSPLIDRKSGLVVGVHSCCADYSLKAPNATLPVDRFLCASKRDTVSNQAVSTWSIWHEPKLADVLKKQGVTPESAAPSGTQ